VRAQSEKGEHFFPRGKGGFGAKENLAFERGKSNNSQQSRELCWREFISGEGEEEGIRPGVKQKAGKGPGLVGLLQQGDTPATAQRRGAKRDQGLLVTAKTGSGCPEKKPTTAAGLHSWGRGGGRTWTPAQ